MELHPAPLDQVEIVHHHARQPHQEDAAQGREDPHEGIVERLHHPEGGEEEATREGGEEDGGDDGEEDVEDVTHV